MSAQHTAPRATAPAPIVLLPGHLCGPELWRHQAARLTSLGHEVHILPLRALDSIAAHARDVLDRAPPLYQLVGFSMGGYVALEIMRQAPHRVTRLALMSTTPYADTRQRREQREQNIAQAQAGAYDTVLRQFVTPPPYEAITPARQALIDEVYTMMRRFGVEDFTAQHRAIATRRDATGVLPGIQCPVGIFYGEADLMTPPGVHHALARAMPHALCVGLPDTGHMMPLEQPGAVGALLEAWLQWPASASHGPSTAAHTRVSAPPEPAAP